MILNFKSSSNLIEHRVTLWMDGCALYIHQLKLGQLKIMGTFDASVCSIYHEVQWIILVA